MSDAATPLLRRSSTLSLGLNLPYAEGSMDGATPRWADILAMATAAEAIGFEAVWISDHVGFGDPDGDWSGAWESWTLLSALAAVTRHVRLGTYVTAMPYRNPALLAKMAETLDEVSGGRVVLGLGAGWNEPEFTAYGFPWAHRFDRFEDGLRIVTAMLRTSRADHDGEFAVARGARLAPRGPRPSGLPVMVGGIGPRMLRLTAELADEWNAGMRSPEDLVPLLALVDEACEDAGRAPFSLPRSAEVLVRSTESLTADDEHQHALTGSPGEIAGRLLRYAALRVTHVQVQLRPNSLDGVRAFAPVIEALRASVG